jgi:hypothetical protein
VDLVPGRLTHLADISTRMDDLHTSLVALLVAEACNVGLTPVIKAGTPALTRGRLSHVDQNYVRAETHAAPNAVLIEAQAGVPIVSAWGGGMLASVDGLRPGDVRHPIPFAAGPPGPGAGARNPRVCEDLRVVASLPRVRPGRTGDGGGAGRPRPQAGPGGDLRLRAERVRTVS